MAASKKDSVKLLVGEAGQLCLEGFEPRTFKKALKGALQKGWEKEPRLLAAAIKECPDLLTVALGLMQCYRDALEEERVKAEVRIKVITEELEKSAEDGAELKPEENKDLMYQYEALAVIDERIWAVDGITPSRWVKSLAKREYRTVVRAVRQFLEQPVNESWASFSAVYDSGEACTANLLRQLPAEIIEELGMSFSQFDGDSVPACATVEKAPADLNKIAASVGLNVVFQSEPPAEDEPEEKPAKAKKDKKAKKAKKAEKPEKPAAEPAPEPVAEPAPAPAEKPAEKPAKAKKAKKAKKAAEPAEEQIAIVAEPAPEPVAEVAVEPAAEPAPAPKPKRARKAKAKPAAEPAEKPAA